MTTSTKPETDWMQILRDDIAATGSISKTAKRVGVSRPTISQILNGIGHYGSGRASTAKVEEKVMHTIGMVACPFLAEYHGTEHRITGLQCREHAYRENPPTNSPRDMQHWRACQACDKRVKQAVVVVKKTEKKSSPSTLSKVGRTGGGDETYQEGWDSIGGPQDNPYPVEDQRHDYWAAGFEGRRAFDRKHHARLRKSDDIQQAGVIDTVTLPLPEVGAPQIQLTKEVA
jgi:transcriptional regulator with XRE-family HTH domain